MSFKNHQPDWGKAVVFSAEQPALLPLVCQNVGTGQVLMVGYVSKEAWEQTQSSGEVVFWSRSKGRLWKKGESSGHTLKVRRLLVDCDADALLALVEPQGPTCHRQSETCFDPETAEGGFESVEWPAAVLARVFATIQKRAAGEDPDSYTQKLLSAGIDRVLRKLGEECTEAILAAKNLTITEQKDEFCSESADLIYHWLVTLAALKITPDEVWAVLKSREGGPRRVQVDKV